MHDLDFVKEWRTDVSVRGADDCRYVALAWKDPKNIVEELSPKAAGKE